MNITKCDICNKKIEDREEVSIGYLNPFPQYSLCLKCAKPVVTFLQKDNLIDKE